LVADSILYVADDDAVAIINVSNPAEPVMLYAYESVSRALDVYIDGKYLYVADADFGLRILDVTNPSSPALVRDFEKGELLCASCG
jgi:hypothetical protein